jgi:hypothetical protein
LGARRLARLGLSFHEVSCAQRLALLRRFPALCYLHPGGTLYHEFEFELHKDEDFDELLAELQTTRRRVWFPEWHDSDDDQDEAAGEGDDAEPDAGSGDEDG